MTTELIRRTEMFEGQEIEILDKGGEIWLGVSQIATALGFKNRAAIQDIFRRHRDEFAPDMTQIIKVPTAGGEQEVRIFSWTGGLLLAALSRTPRGAIVRRWLITLAARHKAQSRTGAGRGAEPIPSVNDASPAPDFNHTRDDCPLCRPEQWLTTGQLAARWGISISTVRHMIQDGRLEAMDVLGKKLVAVYIVRALEKGYRRPALAEDGERKPHGWSGLNTDGYPFLVAGGK